MEAQQELEPEHGQNLDVPRMYRFAMTLTILLCVGSALALIAHWMFGILSQRTTMVMAVGIGFWLLMFFGYRGDLKAQLQREENARRRKSSQTP